MTPNYSKFGVISFNLQLYCNLSLPNGREISKLNILLILKQFPDIASFSHSINQNLTKRTDSTYK